MATFLKWFIRIWISLILLLVLISIFGTYMSTQSFGETLSWVQATFSPFNIWNFLLMVVLISPVILADKWKDKIETREPPKPKRQKPTKKYPY